MACGTGEKSASTVAVGRPIVSNRIVVRLERANEFPSRSLPPGGKRLRFRDGYEKRGAPIEAYFGPVVAFAREHFVGHERVAVHEHLVVPDRRTPKLDDRVNILVEPLDLPASFASSRSARRSTQPVGGGPRTNTASTCYAKLERPRSLSSARRAGSGSGDAEDRGRRRVLLVRNRVLCDVDDFKMGGMIARAPAEPTARPCLVRFAIAAVLAACGHPPAPAALSAVRAPPAPARVPSPPSCDAVHLSLVETGDARERARLLVAGEGLEPSPAKVARLRA